jgi:single-stranded DNA-specific DHH superfamily exonuclease
MDLKIKNKKLFDEFSQFMQGIKKEDKVALLHHTDPDGICSGVIIAKTIEKLRGRTADLRLNQRGDQLFILPETVEQLKSQGIKKIIIVDMGVDQRPEQVKAVEKFCKVLIIDHHKIYNNLSSKKTIFIKPQTLFEDPNPASYCASKLCFDLCSEIADIKELDWIASIGVIGDCAFTRWKDFLGEVFRKYSLEKKEEIFRTIPGKTASLISEVESFSSAKIGEIFDTVYHAEKYEDILNSKLVKFQEQVKSEIDYWLGHVNDFADIREEFDLIFYLIKPKFNIKANISTILSLKNPNKTIIVVQDMGEEMIGISGRRRDEKIAINDLLEKATENMEDASAGGHIPAAGGKVRRQDLSKFKDKLMELVKQKT